MPRPLASPFVARIAALLGRAAPVAVLALAAVLRFVELQHDGMWSDECLTANWARLPWRGTLAAAALDNNAPLYFLVARVPTWVIAHGELPWRALPALLGVALVWAVLAVGRRLLSPAAGLTAAFLAAISPVLVHYSREARNYSMLTLLVLLAFAAAARVRDHGGMGRQVVLASVLAAAFYTHTIAVLAMLGIVIAWACFPFDRKAAGRLAVSAVLAAAAFAPWMPNLFRQEARLRQSYVWIRPEYEREFPWQVARSLVALSPGSLAPVRNQVIDLIPQAFVSAVLVAALAALALARRRAFAEPAAPQRLAVATLVPLVGLMVASVVGTPIYVVGRTDVFVTPFLLLLAAAGACTLPVAPRVLASLAFAGVALLPLQVLFSLDVRSQEKLITTALSGARGPGEPVLATTMVPCLEFYGGLRIGEDLLAFPPPPASTADWIDWKAHPPHVWPEEARAAAVALGQRAPHDRRSRGWVICGHDPLGQALTAVLDGTFPRLGAVDLHYRGLELRVYGLNADRAP